MGQITRTGRNYISCTQQQKYQKERSEASKTKTTKAEKLAATLKPSTSDNTKHFTETV